MTSFLYSVPASRREAQVPEGLPIELSDGTVLTLPAELPVDALDPFLAPELDLAGVIAAFLEVYANDKAADSAYGDALVTLLTERPNLPFGLVSAIHDFYRLLFGAEQYVLFQTEKPSINDYARLTAALLPVYGVSLGKLWSSDDSSEPAGTTSKPTSSASTTSTRARSGAAKARSKASSAPAA